MCPSLSEIGSKTAEKNSAQTDYENNGHLAVNQTYKNRELQNRQQENITAINTQKTEIGKLRPSN